jgi:hypothetical protein
MDLRHDLWVDTKNTCTVVVALRRLLPSALLSLPLMVQQLPVSVYLCDCVFPFPNRFNVVE